MSAAGDVLRALASRYRADAAAFKRYSQHEPAALLEQVAEDLEAEGEAHLSERLTIAEAAEESGYSESRLYHLVSEGTIPNAGESGSPRIRRADLPRKGSRLDQDPEEGDDFAAEILRRRIG